MSTPQTKPLTLSEAIGIMEDHFAYASALCERLHLSLNDDERDAWEVIKALASKGAEGITSDIA